MKKRVIRFGVYYVLFLIFAVFAAFQGWNLRIPMILLLLILLYVSIGGGEDYAGNRMREFHDNPMTASEIPCNDRDRDGLPFLTVVFLILPPALYLIWDFLIKPRLFP